jgi:hypothetical protein
MERQTLQLLTSIQVQKDADKKIEDLEILIKKSKEELKIFTKKLEDERVDIRKRIFYEHYSCEALEIYEKYAKRLVECCGQSDGYMWWLPTRDPGYCHCRIISYDKAQPTLQEKDAFWAIYGYDMKIPDKSKISRVRWGN